MMALIALGLFAHNPLATVILVALLGFTGFATVPPLQMRALENAAEAPTLASALNIAAFNLGNALGAWVGGVAIDTAGIGSTAWAAACISGLGFVVAVLSVKLMPSTASGTVPRELMGH